MSYEGHIEVIYGPMFSGKSSELLRKVRRYHYAKKRCLVINYMHDNRYSDNSVMMTHDKQTQKAIKTASLTEVRDKVLDFDVVAIDEGQFFTDIVDFCEQLANLGIIVIVAALDGTFQRKPFGNILSLLPISEKVYKLTAVCVYCTKPAAFSKRITASQEIELIGGEQTYKPVCRRCFNINHEKMSATKTMSSASSEGEVEKVASLQNLQKPLESPVDSL